jgi:hypothetical protein
MTIPKWILHPTLLITAGGLLMYFFWLSPPTPQTVRTAVANTPVTAAPLPPKTELRAILDISQNGLVTIDGLEAPLKIADARFDQLNATQVAAFQNFFSGKLVRKTLVDGKTEIQLPLEVFDSACYTPPTDAKTVLGCPVLLQP